MKKFILSFVSLFVLALAGWAEDPIKTLTFPDYNDSKVSSYTGSWTATVDGETWSLSGFNNNNSGWAYVKCGQKSAENTASITSPAFAAKVSSVVYTVDKTANVNSATFTIKNGDETVSTSDVTANFAAGDVTVAVTDGKAGYTYTLTLVSAAGSNGSTQISKVAVYGEIDESIVKAPAFSVAGGAYYAAQSVEITCATDGATIKYSTDGENYSEYTGAVTISEDATLYAYAEKEGMTTSSTTTATYQIAKTYASLADLYAVDANKQPVIVTLTNEKIDSIYVSKSNRNGIYLTAGENVVEIYCYDVPEAWVAGGYVSGTIQGTWTSYKGMKEVCPSSWDALTYFYPPVADGEYLLQNVETGTYLGGGVSWGTRACLSDEPQWFGVALSGGAYTLDSHQYNSATSHFLGSGDAPYCDAAATAYTIAETETAGVYTIANASGNYLTGAGNNAGVVTGTDATAAAAQWKFITKADLVAAQETATITAPVDVTGFIQDPQLKRNHNYEKYWTITGADGTGTPSNFAQGQNSNYADCAESYHSTNGFKAAQTITDLKAGVYALGASGFYRQDGSDETYPYIYAGEAKSVLPERTGSENNMVSAYASFLAGNYKVDPVYFEVEEGASIEIGVANANTSMWNIFGQFTLKYYGADASIADVKAGATLEAYKAVTGKKMNTEVSDAMEAAKTTYDADPTDENLATLTAAVNEATASVTAYANAANVLPQMKALTEATNFYTADALDAYYTQPAAKYEDGTLTTDEANALQNPYAETGWHASLTADDLLLSTWKINDVQCQDYTAGMYINTWSVEGDTDGSEFKVPFFEYWTGDANSLGKANIVGTIEGLEAGTYDVTAWVRVRLNNNSTDQTATGITFNGVDACAGEQVGTTQFRLMQVAATAEVGEDGVLTATFAVDSVNNISWLSFQNVNYKKQEATLLNTFVAASISGNALSSDVCATFEEWSDHIVIKSFDGVEGHDLNIGFDDTAYTTINGEENPWIEFTDATYWGGYFYPGYTGGNWDENGGEFWVGAYVYDSDNNYAWKYFYYDLCKDYTSSIVNADLATTDAWDQTETKGISDNLCKVSSGKVFDFSQTINLPAGKYQLTANAAYRYSGSEADEYTAIAAGTETHLAKLYATTATYDYVSDVKNRYEGATDAALDGTSAVEVNGKYVPNSSADVQTYMNAGQYVNNVVFNVQEDGAVKIGIRKTESPEAGDYTVIGTWSLLRLGDAEADPSPETVDIAGAWYENTTGMYYGSDWEDFSLTDNAVNVTVDGTTATFTGLLGDNTNALTATIDGTTLTFTKGQTIAYGGYDWELGTEDADGAEADLVGTIAEDGSSITLDGINIFYSGYSYMYNTKVTLTRDKGAEPEPETGDIVADRTNWTITAPNTCPSGYEGTNDGNIAAAIDASTTTFYHSDWSGSSLTSGDEGLQGFLIDMSESIDVLGFSYAARANSTSGHATAYRLYAYNELPACLAHIDSLTSENKDVVLGADNAELGTPVSQSGDILFTYAAKTDIQTIGFPTTNARYVLFVMDKGTDAWLTCSDFNLYTAMDKREYTVTSNKEDGGITYDGAAVEGTLTVDGAIDLGKVQVVEKEGYEVAITMNGTAITVAYTNILVPDMAALLATAEAEYAAGNTYTYSDGLITSVDQLSSPYTESNEGSLANLLDGDSSTFWHSAWSAGSVDDGVHYLEIALPENTTGDIELDLTRRSNASNDHLTKADIIGVNADGTTEVVATVDLPFGSATETVKATFTLDKAYSSIRILEKTTTTGRGYWHAGEIQLYQIVLTDTCLNAQNPEEAAAMAAAIEAAKAVADDPSQADIDALQAAYDAYHDALYPVFDYVYEGYVGSYYEGEPVDVNLTAILKKIGAADMTNVTVYSEEPDGTRTNSVRGNTDGWRDATGKFVSWGADAYFYVQDNSELPGAQYYVGGYPGKTDEPCSFTATLVYVNNDTQAEKAITITLNYVEAPEIEIAAIDSVEASVEYSYTDGSYTEKIVTLTDDQVSQICTALGLSALSEATVYGYNPTTQEYLASYAAYDGWRDANGDFANWAGNSDVPFCVKYNDGQNYYCYNIEKCWQSATCYWAIANDKNEAVLVKITFTYTDVPTNINGVDANENATIYNLNGVKLNKMQRGINIVNGVKVIKK